MASGNTPGFFEFTCQCFYGLARCIVAIFICCSLDDFSKILGLRKFPGLRIFLGLRKFPGLRKYLGLRKFPGLRIFLGLRKFPGLRKYLGLRNFSGLRKFSQT